MLTLETSILIAIIIASAAYVWRKSSSAKTALILLDKSDKLCNTLLVIISVTIIGSHSFIFDASTPLIVIFSFLRSFT